uniref:Uncharacterized protein n=1 Tax=Globodera rostochiensis TaxID=31243 RepID=A0A914HAY9_GLORO
MKSEWDPLKTKSDIKQRLNRLFGRFDQYSEFAVKPRVPDDTLTERVTATTTSDSPDPAKEKGQTLREREEGDGAVCQQQNDDTAESRDLEDLIGRLVNVSKPLSPVRFASEKPTTSSEIESSVDTQLAEQPECSTRLSSDLDVLLQHITFVEPLISPIRSDSSFCSEDTSKRKKRPLCSPRFDDVPKRLALQADGHKSAEPLTREQPATARSHKIKLFLTKQSFLRLEQVHDKKLDRQLGAQAHQTPPQEAPLANGSAGGQPQIGQGQQQQPPTGSMQQQNEQNGGDTLPTSANAKSQQQQQSHFGLFPPPPPFMPFPQPPLLDGLSDAEIVAMEGTERRAVEARIQSLRNISILLDAALLQFQHYLRITSPGITSLVQRDENSAQNSSTSTERTNPDQQQTGTET